MKHKATKKNYNQVVDKLSDYLKKTFNETDDSFKKEAVQWLNDLLDELLAEDFFGTEGQCDPRGDQRD